MRISLPRDGPAAAWEECDGRYSSGPKGYREVDLERVVEFFEAHEELGYVTLGE